MDKEEYYKRIERINNRFKTDRVSADEEYQLVCQRNYLSTKYIEHLEQQVKKQKEVINETINAIDLVIELIKQQPTKDDRWILDRLNGFKIILEDKEASK